MLVTETPIPNVKMTATNARSPVRSPVEMVYSTIRLIIVLVLAKLYSDFRFLSRATSAKARMVSANTAIVASTFIPVISVEAFVAVVKCVSRAKSTMDAASSAKESTSKHDARI